MFTLSLGLTICCLIVGPMQRLQGHCARNDCHSVWRTKDSRLATVKHRCESSDSNIALHDCKRRSMNELRCGFLRTACNAKDTDHRAFYF